VGRDRLSFLNLGFGAKKFGKHWHKVFRYTYNQRNAVSTIEKKESLKTEKRQNKQFRAVSATSDVLKTATGAAECRVSKML
jgi:hypothetical protein